MSESSCSTCRDFDWWINRLQPDQTPFTIEEVVELRAFLEWWREIHGDIVVDTAYVGDLDGDRVILQRVEGTARVYD